MFKGEISTHLLTAVCSHSPRVDLQHLNDNSHHSKTFIFYGLMGIFIDKDLWAHLV